MNKINWNNPKFGKKELTLVKEVLKTGYVSEGPMTRELEKQLGKIVGAKHVIMTTSCCAALYLAIEADKRIRKYNSGTVVIPNLTFIATKNAVELAGLNVELTDVNDKNYIMEFTKTGKQPRIIIPVNLLGRGTYQITQQGKDKTTIIMDNAGCLGSKVPNGRVGCYSLQANKMVTCGQGGFCATDDDEYAKIIRQIKDFGREDKYQQNTIGFNFKFNDIQAAVVLGQLEQLEERKVLHVEQWERYYKALNKYGKFIFYEDREVPLWIEFKLRNEFERDYVFYCLKEEGIECRKPWTCFSQDKDKYDNSIDYQDTVIWLPNGDNFSKKYQDRVINAVKKVFNNHEVFL